MGNIATLTDLCRDKMLHRSRGGSKFEALSEAMVDYVGKHLAPGDRFFTDSELQKALGVSRITVRHGVDFLVKRGALKRYKAKGTFVANKENLDRKLRIAIFSFGVPLHLNSVYYELYSAIKASGTQTGVHYEYYNLDKRELEHYDRLEQVVREMDGAILVAQVEEFLHRLILRHHIPAVVVDYHGKPPENVNAVEYDNRMLVKLAMDHLVDCGHERIGFLARHLRFLGWKERADLYRAYLERGTLPFVPAFCQTDNDRALSEKIEALADLNPRPTAIFCACANDAVKALDLLSKKGLRVPADISVIGADDIPEARKRELTTVRTPFVEMGKMAVEMIHDAIQHGMTMTKIVYLKPELIIRNTVAARERNVAGEAKGENRNERLQSEQ